MVQFRHLKSYHSILTFCIMKYVLSLPFSMYSLHIIPHKYTRNLILYLQVSVSRPRMICPPQDKTTYPPTLSSTAVHIILPFSSFSPLALLFPQSPLPSPLLFPLNRSPPFSVFSLSLSPSSSLSLTLLPTTPLQVPSTWLGVPRSTLSPLEVRLCQNPSKMMNEPQFYSLEF